MNVENKKGRSFLLIELLESFSESELEGLESFVTCKHFNTDKYIVRLLNVLKKKIIGKRHLSAENQDVVYGEVFSDLPSGKLMLTKAQKATFNAKMNALTRLAERFLIIEALEKDEVYRSDLLCRELLRKKQFKLFSRHLKRGEKQMPIQSKDGNIYLYQYKMETNRLNYLHRSGRLVQEDNLSELNRSLDIYYLLNKLNIKVTTLSLMNNAQKTYDFSDSEGIELLLNLPQYKKYPLLNLYRTIVDLLFHKNHDAFTKLIRLIGEDTSSIPIDDIRVSYIVATNYCTSEIRKGYVDYYQHLISLYSTMDKKGLLLEDNLIDIAKLKNIVTAGSRIGEFEWATEIIEKYRPSIMKRLREDVCNHNLGVIAFYKKNYREAIDYLYPTDNINTVYDLNRRIMIIKSYYEIETEYKEATAQMFRSIEKYVKEHRILPTNQKRASRTFIRLLINLYRVRHREGKMTLESIKKKLENAEFINDKKWLLEKIEELEKTINRRR